MRVPLSPHRRGGSIRKSLGTWGAIATLLFMGGCDDTVPTAFAPEAAANAADDGPRDADLPRDAQRPDAFADRLLSRSDLTVVLDYGPLPDLGPLPADEGAPPDATPPATVGPPHLRLLPSAVSLREAREPVVLQVSLEGSAPAAPVEVTLSAPAGMTVEPVRLTLHPGQRSAWVSLSAEIDADAEDRFGRVEAEAAGLPLVSVPFVVYDAHLTWEMVFDPEELAFVRTSNDKSRRILVENVINGRDVAGAEINLRGKGTLVCPRRSFTVRFLNPVHLRSSPPLEDVNLIALCEDPLVLRSRISLELLGRLGLFPSWFSYVELQYGGDTRGVYLMLERPRSAIERNHPDNSRVIRRLSDVDAEIDHPDEDSIADREAFLASYRALFSLHDVLQGEALLAELQRRMQYDQYLLWLAYNSAMENGDNIDEVFFYDRAPPANRPGAEQPFYAVMAWDQDEIFRPCHTPSPLREPLTSCAESGLDRLVVRQPVVRAVYLTQLRRLLEGPVSAGSFAPVAARAAAELAVYLDRPGVRELHTVPDMAPPVADASRQAIIDLVTQRRELLMPLLEAAERAAQVTP